MAGRVALQRPGVRLATRPEVHVGSALS